MESIRGKSEIVDPCYRYKMRKLIVQREKTKTCITNLRDVATDLKIIDPDLIVSFMKKRTASAITFKNDKAIITNDADTKKIQTALYEFIEYFVLCRNQKCKLPELSYSLDTKHQLRTLCRSCGHSSTIEANQYTEKVIKDFETKLSKMHEKKKEKKTKKQNTDSDSNTADSNTADSNTADNSNSITSNKVTDED